MDKVKVYAKALAAFLSAFTVLAGSLAASPAIVAAFPATWVAWLGAIGAAGAIGGLVLGIPNKLTAEQVLKQAPAIGIAVGTTVANAAIDQVSSAVQTFINTEAQNIAQPSKGQVVEIAAQVPAVVDKVTTDVVDRILGEFTNQISRVGR